MMLAFRIALVAGWCALVWFTVAAIEQTGPFGAGAAFFSGAATAWQAQFNVDLGVHLLMVAGWIAWREKTLLRKVGFGAAAILFGGVFSLPYIFLSTFGASRSGSEPDQIAP